MSEERFKLHVKIQALVHGVRPTRRALKNLTEKQSKDDYPTTTGRILVLFENVYINARFNYSKFFQGYGLDYDDHDDIFFLFDEENEYEATILPLADYVRRLRKTQANHLMKDLVVTHADRVRIMPLYGCSYTCRFCNQHGKLYRKNDINELDEAFRTAMLDRLLPPTHALISGGTPYEDDFDFLNDVFAYFPQKYPDIRFDVMTVPRGLKARDSSRQNRFDFIRFLHDSGVNTVSINMELWDALVSRNYCPQKYELGTKTYLDILEKAVEIFKPVGISEKEKMIRSVIIAGLEDYQYTIEAVKRLAQIGVLSEISPFIPHASINLAHYPAPNTVALETMFWEANEVSLEYGIPLISFCEKCSHNIINCDVN